MLSPHVASKAQTSSCMSLKLCCQNVSVLECIKLHRSWGQTIMYRGYVFKLRLNFSNLLLKFANESGPNAVLPSATGGAKANCVHLYLSSNVAKQQCRCTSPLTSFHLQTTYTRSQTSAPFWLSWGDCFKVQIVWLCGHESPNIELWRYQGGLTSHQHRDI